MEHTCENKICLVRKLKSGTSRVRFDLLVFFFPKQFFTLSRKMSDYFNSNFLSMCVVFFFSFYINKIAKQKTF